MSEGALSTITCIEILFSYVHTVQQQDIKGKQSLYNQYGRVMLFSKVLHDELCFFFSFIYICNVYTFNIVSSNPFGDRF